MLGACYASVSNFMVIADKKEWNLIIHLFTILPIFAPVYSNAGKNLPPDYISSTDVAGSLQSTSFRELTLAAAASILPSLINNIIAIALDHELAPTASISQTCVLAFVLASFVLEYVSFYIHDGPLLYCSCFSSQFWILFCLGMTVMSRGSSPFSSIRGISMYVSAYLYLTFLTLGAGIVTHIIQQVKAWRLSQVRYTVWYAGLSHHVKSSNTVMVIIVVLSIIYGTTSGLTFRGSGFAYFTETFLYTYQAIAMIFCIVGS